jgi:hypothetical protein
MVGKPLFEGVMSAFAVRTVNVAAWTVAVTKVKIVRARIPVRSLLPE